MAEFMRTAAPEHKAVRSDDDDHAQDRAVVCEPSTNALVRYVGRPMPALFTTAEAQEGSLLFMSDAGSESAARRARATLPHLRWLFEATRRSADAPLVKLALDDDTGSREHMRFRLNGLPEDMIDATLLSSPFAVGGMYRGHRGVHPAARLSDWMVPTREGMARPWFLTPVRKLRGG